MTRFAPGQKILWQNDLRFAWEFEWYSPDGLLVRAGQGNAIMIGPVEQWIAAPENWRDAPVAPAEFEGRFDMAIPGDPLFKDPLAQLGVERYLIDFANWDTEVRQPLLRRLRETGK